MPLLDIAPVETPCDQNRWRNGDGAVIVFRNVMRAEIAAVVVRGATVPGAVGPFAVLAGLQ